MIVLFKFHRNFCLSNVGTNRWKVSLLQGPGVSNDGKSQIQTRRLCVWNWRRYKYGAIGCTVGATKTTWMVMAYERIENESKTLARLFVMKLDVLSRLTRAIWQLSWAYCRRGWDNKANSVKVRRFSALAREGRCDCRRQTGCIRPRRCTSKTFSGVSERFLYSSMKCCAICVGSFKVSFLIVMPNYRARYLSASPSPPWLIMQCAVGSCDVSSLVSFLNCCSEPQVRLIMSGSHDTRESHGAAVRRLFETVLWMPISLLVSIKGCKLSVLLLSGRLSLQFIVRNGCHQVGLLLWRGCMRGSVELQKLAWSEYGCRTDVVVKVLFVMVLCCV